MSLAEDLNNPNLFTENKPGDYEYGTSEYGKTARGQLCLSESPQRDSAAQRSAGGEARRGNDNPYGVDDGGHLIGARFGGEPGAANLTAQDRNLNRSGYLAMENSWAQHLEDGDRVFVNVESYDGEGSERPTNYMGYVIIEHTDENGQTSRSVEYISLNNESKSEQATWEEAETAYNQEHPEVAEAQRAENTAMPYQWDDEKGEAVPNPYYQETLENAAQNGTQTENTGAASKSVDSSVDYTAGTETGTAEQSDNTYAPESSNEQADAENTTDYAPEASTETSTESENDGGMESDGGQDMD